MLIISSVVILLALPETLMTLQYVLSYSGKACSSNLPSQM